MLYKKKFQTLLLIVFILLVTDIFAESLDDIEARLLSLNPSITVANQALLRVRAAEKIPGSLPAPVVKFSYFGENVETRTGPQQWTLGLSQKIPWPGKLSKIRTVAKLKSIVLESSVDLSKREVLKEFRFIWSDYYLLEQSILITTEIRKLNAQWLERSRSGYETGKTPFSSLIKMENHIATLDDNLRSFSNDKEKLIAKFSELFGTETTLQPPTSLQPLPYDTTESALQNHPMRIAIKSSEKVQAENTRVQKSRLAPDLGVGFNYINIGERKQAGIESGKDAWAISASMNLPIWFNSAKSGIESSRIKEKELASKEIVINNFLKQTEVNALLTVDDTEKRIELYNKTVIPQMRQIISVQESEYETGKGSFIDLFDSYQQLLKLELDVAKAEQKNFKAQAILSWLTISIEEEKNYEN